MVLRPRNGISLCSGGGGLELGLQLAEPSFACRCFVEADADAQAVLVGGMVPDELDRLYAQLAASGLPDGIDPVSRDTPHPGRYARPFHEASVWSDVRTFVGDAWRGHIDLISAGYPCQPFSAAGKRSGSDDPRHLWPDVGRIYHETGATWGVFENVAGHLSLGLETVLRDIWDMGATPAVGLFSSDETGGSHERKRVFIVAHRAGERTREVADADRQERSADSRESDTGPDRRNDTRRGGNNALGDTGHDHDARRLDRGTDSDEASGGKSQHESRGKAPPGQRIRGELSGSSDDVADAIGSAGHKRSASQLGGCSGSRKQGQATGFGRSLPYLSPPGPGETEIWGHVLTLAPDLAPSLAFRDLISRANDLAAMVAEGRVAETQAQSDLCRMANALSTRPRRLRMLGNAVDPLVAGYAWRTLSAAHGLRPLDLEAALRTSAGEFV